MQESSELVIQFALHYYGYGEEDDKGRSCSMQ
jgi:hypothetical protein